MAFAQNSRNVTGIAAIDLSSLVYHFCVWTSTAQNVTSGTTTLTAQGQVDGIVGEGVASGEEVPVVIADGALVKVKSGAAVTAGDVVATAADGRCIARNATIGSQGWGVAITAAGAADEIITIQFGYKGHVNA